MGESHFHGAARAEFSPSIDIEERRKLEEWAERLKLNVADLEVFCRNGYYYEKVPAQDGPNRRSLLAFLKKRETPASKWILISGLFPEIWRSLLLNFLHSVKNFQGIR